MIKFCGEYAEALQRLQEARILMKQGLSLEEIIESIHFSAEEQKIFAKMYTAK